MSKAVTRILKTYNNNKNFIKNTLLQKNSRLSEKYKCNVYLKREDLQVVRSFKIRGAYNKINLLNINQRKKGVVCASAGNHAQGVAYSCSELNIKSDIFVPENTPIQKINSIKKFSNNICNLHIVGASFDDAYNLSKDFSKKHESLYIHPFGDEDIIYGQGTIAVEIYNLINPDIIIGCIGGGGLMSGVSLFSKGINYHCKLYGVESLKSNAMYQSIKENKIIKLDKIDNFVDGAAVKEVSDLTFDICKNNLDDILLVSNGRVCNTMLELYQNDGIIAEPAGALSLAGLDLLDKNLIKDKNIVLIISGGNNDISRYPEIQELALQYQNLKHYFIIQFSQKPGILHKFVKDILGPNDDITRFEYIKKTNKTYGEVLLGVQTISQRDIDIFKQKLNKNNFRFTYLNDNEQLMSYIV